MIPSTAAFVPGAPGGPELLIILFVLAILFVPTVLVVALAALFLRRSSGDESELRERVAELERELEALRGDDE